MKLDKEKFNKLKQLDRIEFRQKINDIEKRYSFSLSLSFMLIIIVLGLLCILISMNIYQMGEEQSSIDMFNVGALLFKLAFIYFLFEVILMFVLSFVELKKKNELIKEYFVVEVKK